MLPSGVSFFPLKAVYKYFVKFLFAAILKDKACVHAENSQNGLS